MRRGEPFGENTCHAYRGPTHEPIQRNGIMQGAGTRAPNDAAICQSNVTALFMAPTLLEIGLLWVTT